MNAAEPLTLLGGLSVKAFLADYWQRKPLLIRQAMPGFVSPLSAEELAGLALEPEVETRLIRETPAAPGWDLRHGPFTESDFTTLPAQRWTLLLQDMEKHLPELTGVLDQFRFLPDWRIDDLMISYAAPGGSVGAHRDNYDVFLLQAHGQRNWLLDQRQGLIRTERSDTPLMLLDDFQVTDAWVLEPGDMLYLPPGVAHHGVALDACQTWSIGFRAPRITELLGDLMHRLLADQDDAVFLGDAGRSTVAHAAVLDQATLKQVRATIRDALLVDDHLLDRWFASHVTEPKAAFALKSREHTLEHDTLLARMEKGACLMRNPASRIALIDQPGQQWLFIDGQEQPVDDKTMQLLRLITGPRTVSLPPIKQLMQDQQVRSTLEDLINQGHWFFDDDEFE